MDSAPIGSRRLLLFSVFVIATCGIVYELVLGAVGSYLLGDSVRQYSFVIGLYLFSMGIGSYIAKFIVRNLLGKFIEIELLLGLVGGLSSTVLFLLFGLGASVNYAIYLFVLVCGVLVGLEIPLLIRLLDGQIKFKSLVSDILSVDYFGALIASLLFPLLLMPVLGLLRTALVFGLVNIVIGLLLIQRFWDEVPNRRDLVLKGISAALVLCSVFYFSFHIQRYSESLMLDEKIIYSGDTKYQRVVVTRTKHRIRLYLNNNLQFSSDDEYRYHEALVSPAMSFAHGDSLEVLILGGGDGMAAREILRYPQVSKVTLVDLDAGVTELFKFNQLLSQLNGNALNNPKLEVINADAFVWLANENLATGKYHVAIVDFPDPATINLGKLYSNVFFSRLQQVLKSEGIFAIQATSPYYSRRSFWCIKNTISTIFPNAFPYHVNVPTFGEWGFVLAANLPVPIDKPRNKVNGLRFYDYHFRRLCHFEADMHEVQTDINRLHDQLLVKYFQEDWSAYRN